MQKTVLITGGTGLVGTRLSAMLTEKGYAVRHLSRSRNLAATYPAYAWNYQNGTIDPDALTGANYVIHLAGANVAGKTWTAAYKQEILESRTATTALLAQAIAAQNIDLQGFISASAIGYYGDTGDTPTDENGSVGQTFLANISQKWENSSLPIAQSGIRTVHLRIGIVLSTHGGALQKLLPTYKIGVGSYFGNGKLYTAWIHIDDLCAMLITAMENENWRGAYNAVAPEALTGKDFGQQVGAALGWQNALLVGAPAFALKLAMGEMADMLLCSSRIVPTRAVAAGFQFQFADLVPAVTDLVQRKL
jgi:uncharacterized protein